MPESTLSRILENPNVEIFSSASSCDCVDALRNLSLPELHQSLLSRTNGITTFHGYIRLFGRFCQDDRPSLSLWNDRSFWKYSWPSWINDYLVFGETAFGDQYAYRISDLLTENEPRVLQIPFSSDQPIELCATFEEFVETDLTWNIEQPYDELIIQAFEKHGRLSASQHVAYVPPFLLNEEENVDRTTILEARINMITNGEIAKKIRELKTSDNISRIDYFVDDDGHLRLSLS